MNSIDLRFFAAVARSGAMNRAAAELNTVQSNVTSRIRQLESDLGAQLFVRDTRGVSLTVAGTRLLPFAVEIERMIGDARRAVLDDGIPRGPLALGSLETTAAYRLAPIVTTFSAAYPNIDLSVRTATNDVLLSDVLDGRIDGAFVAGPLDRPDFDRLQIFVEELVVVSRLGVASLEAAISQVGLTIVIKGSGCSYRQRFEEILSKRGIALVRRIELGSLDAILSCVAAGLGVTMMPRSVVELSRDRANLIVHALQARQGRVRTLFVSGKRAHKSTTLLAFVEHLKAQSAAA